jgi:chromate reductase
MKKKTIGVVAGSLREGAYSKAVARYLKKIAPENLELTLVDIASLPLYNQDFDADPPAEYTRFRDAVRAMDGFLFVTPEHNRSFPAALKNALDIASRPYGESVWNGKPGGVVSVSPGALGGFGANHHLRQVLAFLNVYAMQQPEAYVGHIADAVDGRGEITDPGVQDLLKGYMNAFAAWVDRF